MATSEMFGANAEHGFAGRAFSLRSRRPAAPPFRRCEMIARSSANSTGKKFIAGEPMKPATNWLAGRS